MAWVAAVQREGNAQILLEFNKEQTKQNRYDTCKKAAVKSL